MYILKWEKENNQSKKRKTRCTGRSKNKFHMMRYVNCPFKKGLVNLSEELKFNIYKTFFFYEYFFFHSTLVSNLTKHKQIINRKQNLNYYPFFVSDNVHKSQL